MTTKKTTARGTATLSAEERAAVKERAQELKAQARKEDGTKAVLAKIAEMSDSDRAMAERIHELVMEHAPDLVPRTFYGMPAYTRDGKNVLFFQPADKFGVRYATLGFDEGAALDQGSMWPNAYAMTRLTKTDEKKVVALIKKAIG
jgi:hypothetical protein